MQTLLIDCALCDWTDILKNYQVNSSFFSSYLLCIYFFKNHLDQIHANPLCTYCEQKFPSMSDLDRHQQYDCEKFSISCPLKQFGCEGLVHIQSFLFPFYQISRLDSSHQSF